MYYFKLKGVTCSSCVGKIEKAVYHIDGVESVSVNLLTEELMVDGMENVSPQAICQVVSELGYRAELKNLVFSKEDRSFNREAVQLIVIIGLMLGVVYLTMGEMLSLPGVGRLDHLQNGMLQCLLTVLIIVWNKEMYQIGIKAIKDRALNMSSLIVMGSGFAFLYSVYGLILGLYQGFLVMGNLYFETVAVILGFVHLGKFIETLSKRKAISGIKQLSQSVVKKVSLVDGEKERLVHVSSLIKGDLVRIKPGGKIPADGYVVEGSTSVDESFLTGESLPVIKYPKDKVYATSLNHQGTVVMRVEKTGDETFFAQIVAAVNTAQMSKPSIQRFVDKLSAIFIPFTLVLGVLTFLFWWMLMRESFSFSLERLIGVLVIACPCALGLATPTAIFIGTTRATQHGILYKNSEVIEKLKQLDTLIFDKTGTITEGKPQLIKEVIYGDKEDILSDVYAVERLSEHPLSHFLENSGYDFIERPVSEFQNLPGQGISAKVNHHHIIIGNETLMAHHGVDYSLAKSLVKEQEMIGSTAIYVAKNKVLSALFFLQDAIKTDSKETISRLQKRGYHVVLASGDSSSVAQHVAQTVGISEAYGQLSPEDKQALVTRLQTQGHCVAVIGDGINDAPALAQADFGVAMGSSADLALESADLILLGKELTKLNQAFGLSQKMLRLIKENLFWAFFYNLIAIPFAMGVPYLFGGPLLNPMIGAMMMSLSSVSVLLNSLRLYRMKLA